MERTILKLEGIELSGTGSARAIRRAVEAAGDPLVVVTSIFRGTDKILAAAADSRRPSRGSSSGPGIEASLGFVREGHLAIARGLGAPAYALEAASLRIDSLVRRLRASLSAEAPAASSSEVLALGSRLSATCIALAMAAAGMPSALVEPLPAGASYSGLRRYPSSVLPGDFVLGAEGRAEFLGREGVAVTAEAVAEELGCALVEAEFSIELDYCGISN